MEEQNIGTTENEVKVEKTKAEINREKKEAYDQQQLMKKRVQDMKNYYKSENEMLSLIVENIELSLRHYQLINSPEYKEFQASQSKQVEE